MSLPLSRRQFGLGSLALGISLLAGRTQAAGRVPMKAVVPGTGVPVARTGDDFEADDWTYYPQTPKSSWNIDKEVRAPGGVSKKQASRAPHSMRMFGASADPASARATSWLRRMCPMPIVSCEYSAMRIFS